MDQIKSTELTTEYIELLYHWALSSKQYLYDCPERPDLTCYGTGENHWGVQTNQKAFAAYAILGTLSIEHPFLTSTAQAEFRNTALRLLRFSLESHIEGSYHCMDGASWGHTWISSLGIERMMHGVEAVWTYLTDEDKILLKKVLSSECNWLLEKYEPVAGLYGSEGLNKPESNLWNGAILYRTALMYPDHPHANQYVEKANRFLINALSIPSDADSEIRYDGRKVSALHVGANFFESFALNHHNYLNVGYMNICLSNVAMLHFSCKRNGWRPPEALYHHVEKLWELVKELTFPDGRLLRIGGDSRVRYAYCQDYALPSWLLVQDVFEDAAGFAFERNWIRLVQREFAANGDGSFFFERGKGLKEHSPLYYTRLESDRAVSLSYSLAWKELIVHKKAEVFQESIIKPHTAHEKSWHDEYHGAYFHRSQQRIASWVWESCEKPQGLCLPPEASDLAEWRENLAGSIQGLGKVSMQQLERHDGKMFPGGFVTWGSTKVWTTGLLAEGKDAEEIALNQLVCVALPDHVHMVVLQRATSPKRRVFLREVKGLHFLVPNDVMNGKQRTYYYADGRETLPGPPNTEETLQLGSKWINVENKLGIIAVYGTEGLTIHRPGTRQIGLKRNLKHIEATDSLYADEICGPYMKGLQSYYNEPIWDAGYVLQSGQNKDTTAQYSSDPTRISSLKLNGANVRGVKIRGTDNKDYLVLANFGTKIEKVNLPDFSSIKNVISNHDVKQNSDGSWKVLLDPGVGAVLASLGQNNDYC